MDKKWKWLKWVNLRIVDHQFRYPQVCIVKEHRINVTIAGWIPRKPGISPFLE